MDQLLLLSGNDIPFPQARVIIHQPRLKEIAYITEQHFWPGCQLFKFDKELLPEQDKKGLINRSNFNLIMTMVQQRSYQSQQAKINMLSILTLIFPTHTIQLGRQTIQLHNQQNNQISEINDYNFQAFKEILIDMFCLRNKGEKQYNPSNDLARKIANKIKRGREEKAKLAPPSKIALLSRYASILAVGEGKDINALMDYTVYQIMDQFTRFQLKLHYDQWVKFKAAGATGMDDPQDWLKDLYDDSEDDDNENERDIIN